MEFELLGTMTRERETQMDLEETPAGHYQVTDGLREILGQDPLTGVCNRLRMEEDLKAIEGSAQRHDLGYAVALCDVDRFKDYNNSRGYQAGDYVLQAVAAAVRSTCRSGDAIYRYGGEELLVLLPGQGAEMATAAAEQMRLAVENLEITHPLGDPLSVVTVSIGVAVRDANMDGRSVEDILSEADNALSRAKREGRNQVATHQSDTR
jgi:diguanylate cyclase (GGDEF)-like protein